MVLISCFDHCFRWDFNQFWSSRSRHKSDGNVLAAVLGRNEVSHWQANTHLHTHKKDFSNYFIILLFRELNFQINCLHVIGIVCAVGSWHRWRKVRRRTEQNRTEDALQRISHLLLSAFRFCHSPKRYVHRLLIINNVKWMWQLVEWEKRHEQIIPVNYIPAAHCERIYIR